MNSSEMKKSSSTLRTGERFSPEHFKGKLLSAVVHFDGKSESYQLCDISSVGIGLLTGGRQHFAKGAVFTLDIGGIFGIECLCVHSDSTKIGGSFANPFDQIHIDELIENGFSDN